MKKRLLTSILLIVSFLLISTLALSKAVFMKDGSIKEFSKVKKVFVEEVVEQKDKDGALIKDKKGNVKTKKVKNLTKVIGIKADNSKEEIPADQILRVGSSSLYKYNQKYYLYKFKDDKSAPKYEEIEGYIVDDKKDNGKTYTMRKELNSTEEFYVKKYDIKYITEKPSPDGPIVKQNANELERDALGKKAEGWYIFPLPFVLGSSDNGVFPFVRVYYTESGTKKSDNWIYSDYEWRILAQALVSFPNLWQYHFIEFDDPFFAGSKLRLKASIIFEDSPNKQFFGISNHTLTNPVTTNPAYTQNELTDALKPSATDVDTYTKYYLYKLINPKAWVNIYYNVFDWLKLTGGVEYKYAYLQTWEGEEFDYEGKKYTNGNPTLYDTYGFNQANDGGSLIQLKAGIGIDTRDFASDPKNGIYTGLKALFGFHLPENTKDNPFFHRYSYDFRIYWSPKKFRFSWSPKYMLTFAAKVGYTTVFGDVPFYELSNFDFFDGSETGIGGYQTSRGYPSGRFVDKTMMLAQFTIRWHIWEGKDPLTKSLWGFKLLGFLDVGRYSDTPYGVFSDNWINNKNQSEWNSTPMSYGFGFIISQNQTLLLHAYFGWSAEGMSFDFNVGHSI